MGNVFLGGAIQDFGAGSKGEERERDVCGVRSAGFFSLQTLKGWSTFNLGGFLVSS